jgi:hypothetical protein
VLSRSHLIPESIGGFAWARTHCKACNEETGTKVEAEIVHDDSIRFSIEAVSSSLPKLAAAFHAKTTYAARTPHGLVRARREGDGFQILPASEGDSRTSSQEDARAALKTRLSRAGCSDDETAEALGLFDRAEIGVPIEIGGATVTHGVVEVFEPELTGVIVSHSFPSLIAFHFVALAIGPNVYDERLDPLRDSIKRGAASSSWHRVESGLERRYAPEHLVGFAQTSPHLVVGVQLFGWNVRRIHFPQISSSTEPFGYLFDLVQQELMVAAPRLTHPLVLPELPD